MNTALGWLFSSTGRRYIYGVAIGIVVVLVGYGFLTDQQAALWTTLLTALLALAPATALAHITPDAVIDGEVIDVDDVDDEGTAG